MTTIFYYIFKINFQNRKWIINEGNGFCLDMDLINRKLIVNACDPMNQYMKWEFGNINITAFNHGR